jgi:acyl-coenzyme A synthetase/AMP-(fatty) acid ligase
MTHPAVRDAVVVGRPDRQYGEVPVAYVVAAGEQTEEALTDDLHRHAAAQVSPYKVPVAVRVVEALPRNANGKINRQALRNQEAHHGNHDVSPAADAAHAARDRALPHAVARLD